MFMASNLHASLAHPVFSAMNFLTEIMEKFPRAISFAPGAPNPTHLSGIEIERHIARYVEYLCQKRSLTHEQASQCVYQYGPSKGIINDLVATALQQDKNIQIASESVVITVGAQEAMFIILRTLFPSTKERLVVVNPCYIGILGAAKLLDIEIVGITETENGIDLDALDKLCDAGRQSKHPIRAFYVAPDFANPTGHLISLSARKQLLALANKHDFFIIEDNTYGFTAPSDKRVPSLKMLDQTARVIMIGSFAKICLPGARVGFVVADQLIYDTVGQAHRLADDLATVKGMITLNTSPICQAIIGGMLLEHAGSLLSLEREKARFYQANLKQLLNILEKKLPQDQCQRRGISWNRPNGGFFVKMNIAVPATMALLEYSASNYNVIWTPMSLFYLDNAVRNEIRLSCSYLALDTIEEGVTNLVNFLCGL